MRRSKSPHAFRAPRKGRLRSGPLLRSKACRRFDDFRVFRTFDARRSPMRYLLMIKYNENGTPPPQSLLDAIEKNRLEAKQAGVLVECRGLSPSASGARIRHFGGKLTFTDGPFTETKELVGGYSIYEVRSKQEAIDWAYRFMRIFAEHWPAGEFESEVRQMFETPAASNHGQKGSERCDSW